MRFFTSPVSPGSERRGGVKSLFREIRMSFHLTIPVVFRLYGKISPHPGEIPPLVRRDFTIPVVLRSSCKHEMKIQRILLDGGISPLSPGSGRWGIFPHINRALEELKGLLSKMNRGHNLEGIMLRQFFKRPSLLML